ncbi:MAG TPA: phenylalanine--tRNA ligase subunit alpha, partial [Candidatus Riflebacteria bacterium]|nr:phenylalanine--tRNA ligase subunit alpha [Candidatus Riflebacteria bacterium]
QTAKSTADLETLRVKYLGKKGEVTELLKGLGKMAPEERKAVGAAINELKNRIQNTLEESMRALALSE